MYFVASGGPEPFVLCGSRAHLLDKRQVPDADRVGWPGFYTAALLGYTRRLAALPDEAAVADPPQLAGNIGMRGNPAEDDDRAHRVVVVVELGPQLHVVEAAAPAGRLTTRRRPGR